VPKRKKNLGDTTKGALEARLRASGVLGPKKRKKKTITATRTRRGFVIPEVLGKTKSGVTIIGSGRRIRKRKR